MPTNYLLTLPFPPSANTYYRRAGTMIYISQQGRAFKEEVHSEIDKQLGKVDLIEGRIGIGIELCAPTRRSYDIDNRIKPLLDALQGKVFVDDQQVDQLHASRLPIDSGGGCYVTITELK